MTPAHRNLRRQDLAPLSTRRQPHHSHHQPTPFGIFLEAATAESAHKSSSKQHHAAYPLQLGGNVDADWAVDFKGMLSSYPASSIRLAHTGTNTGGRRTSPGVMGAAHNATTLKKEKEEEQENENDGDNLAADRRQRQLAQWCRRQQALIDQMRRRMGTRDLAYRQVLQQNEMLLKRVERAERRFKASSTATTLSPPSLPPPRSQTACSSTQTPPAIGRRNFNLRRQQTQSDHQVVEDERKPQRWTRRQEKEWGSGRQPAAKAKASANQQPVVTSKAKKRDVGEQQSVASSSRLQEATVEDVEVSPPAVKRKRGRPSLKSRLAEKEAATSDVGSAETAATTIVDTPGYRLVSSPTRQQRPTASLRKRAAVDARSTEVMMKRHAKMEKLERKVVRLDKIRQREERERERLLRTAEQRRKQSLNGLLRADDADSDGEHDEDDWSHVTIQICHKLPKGCHVVED